MPRLRLARRGTFSTSGVTAPQAGVTAPRPKHEPLTQTYLAPYLQTVWKRASLSTHKPPTKHILLQHRNMKRFWKQLLATIYIKSVFIRPDNLQNYYTLKWFGIICNVHMFSARDSTTTYRGWNYWGDGRIWHLCFNVGDDFDVISRFPRNSDGSGDLGGVFRIGMV